MHSRSFALGFYAYVVDSFGIGQRMLKLFSVISTVLWLMVLSTLVYMYVYTCMSTAYCLHVCASVSRKCYLMSSSCHVSVTLVSR